MTDTRNLDILTHLQKELKLKYSRGFSIKVLNDLLEIYKITSIDLKTIENVIAEIKKQISDMPEPIEIETGKTNRVLTKQSWKNSPIKKIVYKGLSEYESQEVKNKIDTLNLHRIIFEEMYPIVKLIAPQEITTSINSKSKSRKSNHKKDTSSKENPFIDSFIDKCFEKIYNLTDQKTIAKDNGVSSTWITNHFTKTKSIPFLERLESKMNKLLYNSNDENLLINHLYIKDILENLRSKKKMQLHSKSTGEEKQLNKDLKNPKFVSFNGHTENEMNDDTARYYGFDAEN